MVILKSTFVIIIFSLVICACMSNNTATYEDEYRLREHLFLNYSHSIRPVKLLRHSLTVNFTFELLNVQDMDVKTQRLTITTVTLMKWTDENMVWDPANFGGTKLFHVHHGDRKDVWKPPVSAFNTLEDFVEVTNHNKPISIHHNGTVVEESGVVQLSTHCVTDVTYYPFDTQTCDVIMGTFVYSVHEVNLTLESTRVQNYRPNGEWILLDLSGYDRSCTSGNTTRRRRSAGTNIMPKPAIIKKRKPKYKCRRWPAVGRPKSQWVKYPSLQQESVITQVTQPDQQQQDVPTQVPTDLPAPVTYDERRDGEVEKWCDLRQQLIDAHIEEMCPATYSCTACNEAVPDDAIVHCEDCGPMTYLCQPCSLRIHKSVLYHIPCVWKDGMYVPSPLTYTLTRLDSHDCPTIDWSYIDIIDGKGRQHRVMVQFCKCEERAVTLMRYHLWPASPTKPSTAFTFAYMETLVVLQLEAHVPTKAFTCAVEHMVSFLAQRTAVFGRKDIYRAIVGDCVAEYLYHRSTLLTRHTICNHTLARSCPVCQESPKILSMDGNFGLVHKEASGAGYGRSKHDDVFIADGDEVSEFLEGYTKSATDAPIAATNCSTFQAGNDLRSKVTTKKLDVTGVFGSICKHDIPLKLLNMVHGERLAYPVFIMEKILQKSKRGDKDTIVSYDISCLLSKHLQKKTNDALLSRCIFSVPVFHAYAHNIQCQLEFGQRFVEGTGLTDGEGIERLWAYLRPFKRITKEMSLTNRHDLLTEALIHHTLKLISNWSQHVQRKLKQIKAVQEESTANLRVLGESQVTIFQWREVWQSETKSTNRRDWTLTPTEKYAEALEQLDQKRCELNQLTNDTKRAEILAALDRLQQKCSTLAKRSSVKGEDLTHASLAAPLASAATKTRMTTLTSMRQLAADRQYLLAQMKKYADGQSISTHVGKQLSAKTTKLKKDLQTYNTANTTDMLTFSDISSPESPAYDLLSTTVLNASQKGAVKQLCRLQKANEEASIIGQEIKTFQKFLIVASSELNDKIAAFQHGNSRYEIGMSQFLSYAQLNLETLDESLCHFNNSSLSVTPALSRVYTKTFAHDSGDLVDSGEDVGEEDEHGKDSGEEDSGEEDSGGDDDGGDDDDGREGGHGLENESNQDMEWDCAE